MPKKVVMRGVGFFLLGVILLLSSANGLTGFVIAENTPIPVSFLGMLFTFVGSVLLVVGAREPERRAPEQRRDLEVLVSATARDHSRDKSVKGELDRILKQIAHLRKQLMEDPLRKLREKRIGNFRVEEEGRFRIDWDYDAARGVLYIVDINYKKGQKRYSHGGVSKMKHLQREDYGNYAPLESAF